MVYIDVLLFYFAVLLLLRHFVSKGTKCRDVSIFLFALIHSWVGIWLYTLPISVSGDVEVNPGPITKANNWNLNFISAYNYLKLSVLKAHLTTDKFAYQKHALILILHLIMTILEFQGIM